MTGTEPGRPGAARDDDRLLAVRRTPTVPVPRTAAPGEFRPATGSTPPPHGSGLAWLVRPVTHVPGVLHLHDGRLRFVSTRGTIVDASLDSLAIVPARTGRGGFRLTIGDERLRLHVVRFAGAVDVPADLRDREAPGGLLTAGEPAAGALWRRLLAPPRPELVTGTDVGAGFDGADTGTAGSAESGRPGGSGSGRLLKVGRWRPARARRSCSGPASWT